MNYNIIYNDIFHWKGFGGMFKLASGNCRLLIFDLKTDGNVTPLIPYIIVTMDTPAKSTILRNKNLTIRSCNAHIATEVTRQFKINPGKMLWVEFYPESKYGIKKEKIIKESYEKIDFTWKDGKAYDPVDGPLRSPALDMVKKLMQDIK